MTYELPGSVAAIIENLRTGSAGYCWFAAVAVVSERFVQRAMAVAPAVPADFVAAVQICCSFAEVAAFESGRIVMAAVAVAAAASAHSGRI